VPVALYVVPGVRIAVGWLEEKSGTLSKYALVYTGLTGAGFWESAKRGRVLVHGIEGPIVETEPARGERRNVTRKRRFSSERMFLFIHFNLCYANLRVCSTSCVADDISANADIPIRVNDVPIRRSHIRSTERSSGRCSPRRCCNCFGWVVLCRFGQGHVSGLFLKTMLFIYLF